MSCVSQALLKQLTGVLNKITELGCDVDCTITVNEEGAGYVWDGSALEPFDSEQDEGQ